MRHQSFPSVLISVTIGSVFALTLTTSGRAEVLDTVSQETVSSLENTTDSTTVRFLTAEVDTTDYWPSFSPDGKQVLFSRKKGENQPYHLCSIPIDGGEVKPFFQTPLRVGETRANWSWRHNRIAFTGRANSKNRIWIAQGDGTQPHPLAIEGLTPGVAYPFWYADGNRLAVVDYEGTQGGVLKIVDIAQNRATPLTQLQTVLAGMPSVSPDGKTIAFAGQLNQGQAYDQTKNSIWLLDEKQQLRELVSGQGRAPSWSPDGQWVAFESNRGRQDGKYAVYIVSYAGKKLRQITDYTLDANHPVWSPDGKTLAFSALNPTTQTLGIAVVAWTAK